jgi:Domain of unknown function (DUF4153)
MSEASGPVRSTADYGQARLLVGFTQGVALFLLSESVLAKLWTPDSQWIFNCLISAIFFVPITMLVGLGGMRNTTLVAWTIAATAAVVGFVAHSVSTGDVGFSSPPVFLGTAAALFIAYHLVAAADSERRLFASYGTYFDVGWKNGVQFVLSIAFLGAFWILLWLGTALFQLIKIDLPREIIGEKVFIFVATTTAFAAGVHLTDVRVSLINGARAMALVLLSWLLPLMSFFALTFLAALPIVGFELLWATGYGTYLLLTSAGALIVLINAVYQDGDEETPPHSILRLSARLASLALAAIVALAAYAVWLRVEQYGLTTTRVVVIACVAVAACYALGYGIAAIWPGRWMKPLEMTNVSSSIAALALIVLLLTPFGDPSRIAVEDQLRRLADGRVALDKFDFRFLQYQSARYGKEALERLRTDTGSERAKEIARKVEEVLTPTKTFVAPTPQELMAKIVVYPADAKLPESFVKQDWSSFTVSPLSCVREAGYRDTSCEAFFLDVSGDGVAEILLTSRQRIEVFKASKDGQVWSRAGHFDDAQCPGIVEGLRSGKAKAVAPLFRDLEVDGKRVQMMTACW